MVYGYKVRNEVYDFYVLPCSRSGVFVVTCLKKKKNLEKIFDFELFINR